MIDILDYFISFVKQTLILSEEQKYEIIPFLCKYITIVHNVHENEIELALFTNNFTAPLQVDKGNLRYNNNLEWNIKI